MRFNNGIDSFTLQEIIKKNIEKFSNSKEYKLMVKGEEYYKGNNDINKKVIYRYEDGRPVVDNIKVNNKLSHAFMHLLVDDKINYLLTKPYTLNSENEEFLIKIKDILGNDFQKKISRLGVETSNKGISWLHVYIDKNGKLKTILIPSEQIIPTWSNSENDELLSLIRFYRVNYYEGKEEKIETKIEYWTEANVEYYVIRNEEIMLDSESYLINNYDGHFLVNNKPDFWNKIPFIPFKNNDFELPDLQFVKNLIDDYDKNRSEISNLLEEVRNIIYVLKGYGGESGNLSSFMKDLAYYRAILVDDDGGVDTINPTIDISAAKEHYKQLKTDIFDFAQGVDKNSDKLGNSPSGIALKFIYSGLDLKCNKLESNFKEGFNKLIEFIKIFLELTKQGIFKENIEIIFNRDIAINESQAIADALSSKGIISDETIIENHPWVTDVAKELENLNIYTEDIMLPEE